MKTRDYLAGQALNSCLGQEVARVGYSRLDAVKAREFMIQACLESYRWADAMLECRNYTAARERAVKIDDEKPKSAAD